MANLTGGTLAEMFERATAYGSNPDLDIYDVIWQIWINPASIQEGGGKEGSKMSGLRKNLTLCNDPGNIGCAALSLRTVMEDKHPRSKTRRNRDYIFTKSCIELQNELAFEDPQRVTVLELAKFVDLYPSYRLCIIPNLFRFPTIYIGSEYTRNRDFKKDQTIYIYHDLKSNHFSPVSSPGALAIALNKNNHDTSFCYDCCTHYVKGSASSKCACETNQGVRSARRGTRKFCDLCKEHYFNSLNPKKQHRCGESECRFCQQYYNTEQVGLHRCPLYIAPEKLLKVFKGDENPYIEQALEDFRDTKRTQKKSDCELKNRKYSEKKDHQYELWVWDIESHFVLTDGTTEKFETDEDGVFQTDDEGILLVKEITKLAQLGIQHLT
jgi:hypothetical protein